MEMNEAVSVVVEQLPRARHHHGPARLAPLRPRATSDDINEAINEQLASSNAGQRRRETTGPRRAEDLPARSKVCCRARPRLSTTRRKDGARRCNREATRGVDARAAARKSARPPCYLPICLELEVALAEHDYRCRCTGPSSSSASNATRSVARSIACNRAVLLRDTPS